jgi:hypothetical protein
MKLKACSLAIFAVFFSVGVLGEADAAKKQTISQYILSSRLSDNGDSWGGGFSESQFGACSGGGVNSLPKDYWRGPYNDSRCPPRTAHAGEAVTRFDQK